MPKAAALAGPSTSTDPAGGVRLAADSSGKEIIEAIFDAAGMREGR